MTRASSGPGCTRSRGTSATAGCERVRSRPHCERVRRAMTSRSGRRRQRRRAGRAAPARPGRDRGLNPGERDVIELSLVQGLDGDELADALGVSRNHAHALLSRARSQLERSLGALMVARTGRDACAALDALLAGWDGQMTVLMRKRISRHIDQCETCGERKRRELSPALFAGALAAGRADARVPRARAQDVRRPHPRGAGASRERGGPRGPVRPVRLPQAGPPARGVRLAPGPAAFPRPGGQRGHRGGGGRGQRGADHRRRGAAVPRARGRSPRQRGPRRDGQRPRRSLPGPGQFARRRGSGLAPSASPGGTTAPAVLATGPGSHAAPGTSGSATSTSGSSSSGSTSSARRPRRSSSSAPVVQGTLTVSVSRLVLVAVNGHGVGTFTLTAKGGPVSYSISAAAGLSISPASGSLSSGASATHHRDLLQPDLAGRAAHRQPRRLHGHRRAQHLPLRPLRPGGGASRLSRCFPA